jgi:hypothetical protein
LAWDELVFLDNVEDVFFFTWKTFEDVLPESCEDAIFPFTCHTRLGIAGNWFPLFLTASAEHFLF